MDTAIMIADHHTLYLYLCSNEYGDMIIDLLYLAHRFPSVCFWISIDISKVFFAFRIAFFFSCVWLC